jgi:chemotaxis protein CheX
MAQRQTCDNPQDQGEPVSEELRRELLDPFIQAVVFTLGQMTGEEPKVGAVWRKSGYRIFGDHSAVVVLRARGEGKLVLSFPRATSYALAGKMLASLKVDATEEMAQACVSELANIVVGQAKARLAGTAYAFDMSTPTVVAGEGHEIRNKQGLPCLVVRFSCTAGDFALQLCLGFAASDKGEDQ